MADGLDGTVASEVQRASPWLKDCIRCGAPVQKRTRISRQYCSDDCAKRHKAFIRKHRPTPICPICNSEFQRTAARQKYCINCKPNAAREYTRSYNATNLAIVNQARRDDMAKARRADPEKFRLRDREYNARNREKISAKRRTPEYRAKAAARAVARYKLPRNNVHGRISQQIRESLREMKAGRKWETLVGYTVAQLCDHLEKQFTKGMSWENMGEWHIDHITPRKLFEFEGAEDEDFKACWALANLRPLWAVDNQSKSAKRLFLL